MLFAIPFFSHLAPSISKLMNKTIHAIILAGGTDFGRCPIASKYPVCLWPIIGQPAIVRVLNWLAENGIESATICHEGSRELIEKVVSGTNLNISVSYLTETLPWGTAGCIREEINHDDCKSDHYLVCKSNMLTPPPLTDFIANHISSGNLLSLSVNAVSSLKNDAYEATGTYLCTRDILENIPKLGYCDIKERLIPCMVQKDIGINAFPLQQLTGGFRNIKTYYKATSQVLTNGLLKAYIPESYKHLDNDVYVSPSAKIDATARLFGPLVIMDNVKIAANTIIFGPGIIGEGTEIGSGCFLEGCLSWSGTIINANSEIRHSFINTKSIISAGTKLSKEVVYS